MIIAAHISMLSFLAAITALEPPLFDLRDIEKNEQASSAAALEKFLFENRFKNPVGNYVRVDEWEEDQPLTNDDGLLKIASSLVTAARDENDARALSSIMVAYRDGAHEEKIVEEPTGPRLVVGGAAENDGRAARKSNSPFPQPRSDEDLDEDAKVKIPGSETNPRLGARIVSNLATFRSCSGALISYLDHASASDRKTAAWARMIRRSMGVAAWPPDDSCIRRNQDQGKSDK
ncbi:hypothetical protein ACFOWX_01945 [Sphingorhabdus arenilitoris]|uniref:Uncharacterized protein n=1 Tax=Sphingorhabdus arenilitoris TaxID=1490041 RepID=A0ABV8REP1_9SPHN